MAGDGQYQEFRSRTTSAPPDSDDGFDFAGALRRPGGPPPVAPEDQSHSRQRPFPEGSAENTRRFKDLLPELRIGADGNVYDYVHRGLEASQELALAIARRVTYQELLDVLALLRRHGVDCQQYAALLALRREEITSELQCLFGIPVDSEVGAVRPKRAAPRAAGEQPNRITFTWADE